MSDDPPIPETLKPCPFCEGEPGEFSSEEADWVNCKQCGASSDVFEARSGKHITAWNTRAHPRPDPSLLETIGRALFSSEIPDLDMAKALESVGNDHNPTPDSLIEKLESAKTDYPVDLSYNSGLDKAIEVFLQHQADPAYNSEMVDKIKAAASAPPVANFDAADIERLYPSESSVMGTDKAVKSSREQEESVIAPEAAGLETECAQPVPANHDRREISLEKCAIVASHWYRSIYYPIPQWGGLGPAARHAYIQQVKMILDAAGVKYVD